VVVHFEGEQIACCVKSTEDSAGLHRPEQSTEPPWYVIRMPGGVGAGRP